jgi:predicted 3-demethylubiquinone-9 3-methyltransferase (glyoxalase superfamily)
MVGVGQNYTMTQRATLKTFLWYSADMQNALRFYKEIFGDEMVIDASHLEHENLFTSDFSIFGHEIIGMNVPGGDSFNNSISLSIQVDGQGETDRLWAALTEKGEAGRCGWCKDAWGVSWQVTPYQMRDYLSLPDPEKAQQNWAILREMGKIELSKFVQ